jgi:hypothetical protein
MADGAITYLTEGTHSFTLASGATSNVYPSPYAPSQYGARYGIHGFEYNSSEDCYNPVGARQNNVSKPSSIITNVDHSWQHLSRLRAPSTRDLPSQPANALRRTYPQLIWCPKSGVERCRFVSEARGPGHRGSFS